MLICDFCGAENEIIKVGNLSDELCHNCGNRLVEKKFKEEKVIESKKYRIRITEQKPKIFNLFVWVIILPIGILFGILLLYVIWFSWK
jgi:hypothetical protein